MWYWSVSRFLTYVTLVFTCFADDKCSSTWTRSKLNTLSSARYLEQGLDGIVSDVRDFRKDLQRYLRLTKKSHKSKTLTKQKLERIADMSDMAGFKRDRLKPLLKVRVSGTPANVEVQEFLKTYMQGLGWTIEEDRFINMTPRGEREFNNIVATQDPKALRQLVIACHFDSKEYRDIEFIAATDSAVPCAMMLDAAYLLNETIWTEKSRMKQDLVIYPQKNEPLVVVHGGDVKDVSLQFIFFDGEEAFDEWTATDSLYGSRHLASKWAQERHQCDPEASRLRGIDVFMLLDLLGSSNPTFYSWYEKSHRLFKRLMDIEDKLQKLNKFENHNQRYFLKEKGWEFSTGIEDDQRPFEEYNVCILHIIPTPFPKEWHTKKDNEKCLSYETIDNLNKILRVFIAEYLWLM